MQSPRVMHSALKTLHSHTLKKTNTWVRTHLSSLLCRYDSKETYTPSIFQHDSFNRRQSDNNTNDSQRYFRRTGLIACVAYVWITLSANEQEDNYRRRGIGRVISYAKCAQPPNSPNGTGPTVGLRERYNFIADVVEKASPAVVHIKSRYYIVSVIQ